MYLLPPISKCDKPWLGPYRVATILSAVSVTLGDGVVQHISHVRRVPTSDADPLDEVGPQSESSEDSEDGELAQDQDADAVEVAPAPVRRSKRIRDAQQQRQCIGCT